MCPLNTRNAIHFPLTWNSKLRFQWNPFLAGQPYETFRTFMNELLRPETTMFALYPLFISFS